MYIYFPKTLCNTIPNTYSMFMEWVNSHKTMFLYPKHKLFSYATEEWGIGVPIEETIVCVVCFIPMLFGLSVKFYLK